MIRVIIKDYETMEPICAADYSPKSKKNETLFNALKEIWARQKEADILKLGKPCITTDLALGVKQTYSKWDDGVSQTKPFDSTSSSLQGEKEPDTIKYYGEDGAKVDTGKKIYAECYRCGLILDSGKNYMSGLFGMGGAQAAYLTSFTKRSIRAGARGSAKLFPTPQALAKWIDKNRSSLEYLVSEHGYQFNAEYASNQFSNDILQLPESKRDKWEAALYKAQEMLTDINSAESAKGMEFFTDNARRLAEWHEHGEETPPPCSIEEDDLNEEALHRMKSLRILEAAIKSYQDSGSLMMSDNSQFTGTALSEPDSGAFEALRYFNEYGSGKAFHVIKSQTEELGTSYDVLYVSKYPHGWQYERGEKGERGMLVVPSFCTSECVPDGEFGDILIMPVNKGIKRMG